MRIRNKYNEKWEKVQTKAPTRTCDYFISNYGRIKRIEKSTEKEMLLKGSILKASGHFTLNLKLEGKKTQNIYLNRFVAQHFLPPPGPDQKFVIHIDGNKRNNFSSNLKWVTQRELTDSQIERGVYHRDNRKRAPNYKLTVSKVKLIKQRLKAGKTKPEILARQFNITIEHIRHIQNGRNWGDITID